MGVGMVIAIVSVVLIVLPLLGSFTSPVVRGARATSRCTCADARYTVYQRIGDDVDLRSVRVGSDAVADRLRRR